MKVNHIYLGDCRETLRSLPAESMQTCVTSPPYFGLRDYGMPDQIGLEETPEAFVQQLVEVFREVKRVLKEDGTLWVNMGDSYCSTAAGSVTNASTMQGGKQNQIEAGKRPDKSKIEGYKQKDLIGIPWMLAFALRADGWYLRQDIIWHKPNPMPESVTDRCTKSHEYIFLLSKSPKYYYDHKAVREQGKNPADDFRRLMQQKEANKSQPDELRNGLRARGSMRPHEGFNKTWGSLTKEEQSAFGANKRSVWNVATKPFKEAHFATFPEELIQPCILAGSRPDDIVLDPFIGAGTTAKVALRAGRKFIGCELNPDYKAIAERRIAPLLHDLFTANHKAA